MEFFKFVNQNDGSDGSNSERCCLAASHSSAVKFVYHQAMLEMIEMSSTFNFKHNTFIFE